ncbi:hypothetical protein AAVH_22983, partial [Aphelenchoides avenae]
TSTCYRWGRDGTKSIISSLAGSTTLTTKTTTDEYDSLLDQVRAIVGHSAIVEAAFNYQDFISGKALQRLPSLKNVRRLKLDDCRRELNRSNLCARLEPVLKQFDCLKHLELTMSLRWLNWNSLSQETYLRLSNLALSAFAGDRFAVGFQDRDTGFIAFCTDFSCLGEDEKKVVRLRGHECKSGFVLKLVEAFKTVQRKLTVILPRSSKPVVPNKPLELALLTNADGVEVRRPESTTSSLRILQAPAVTVVTNDVEYADQQCAGFEVKKV